MYQPVRRANSKNPDAAAGSGAPNIVPLDRDNGTSNSSNTDVVEKVNFLVAASKHGGTSVAEGSP